MGTFLIMTGHYYSQIEVGSKTYNASIGTALGMSRIVLLDALWDVLEYGRGSEIPAPIAGDVESLDMAWTAVLTISKEVGR
jgi:hypothetical protein